MPGFSASYTHQAGDKFIFKGGVTWPVGISISNGGSAAVYDYFGVDTSWYAGSSWSRPVLDAQRNSSTVVRFSASANYVTLDNFDIKGTKATVPSADASVALAGNHHVTISNCWIHDWTTSVPDTSGFDDGQWGGIKNNWWSSSATIDNTLLITHCDIGNPERGVGGTAGGGGCLFGAGEVSFCKIHDAPQGMLGGSVAFHDNEVYNINYSFDKEAHTNVLYLVNWAGHPGTYSGISCNVYNNYIHDCAAPEVIYPVAHDYGQLTFNIYNNVVRNCNRIIDVDPDIHIAPITINVYNNTAECSTGFPLVRFTDRSGQGIAATNIGNIFNNHMIGSGGITSGPVQQLKQGNNILHTSISAAQTAGYLTSNFYAPSNSSGATVGAGINFSSLGFAGLTSDTSRGGARTPVARPATGAWDVGAYRYGSGSNPRPAPTPTPGASATPNPTATPTPVPTPTPGQPLGLVFDSVSGVITPPFVLNGNNTISQSVQTVDPTQAGRAVYTFNVTVPGDYVVAANVNAPSEGTNSLFLSIDTEPVSPTSIWDIGVTSGFQQRIANWRGTGTDTSDEFQPKTFTLTAGTHQLIILGREAGASIGRITISKLPAPPSNLRSAGP